MGILALMLIGNIAFASDTKKPAKKVKANTECKADCKDPKNCKDPKDCKTKADCAKACTPSCGK